MWPCTGSFLSSCAALAFASQKCRENIPYLCGIMYTAQTRMVYYSLCGRVQGVFSLRAQHSLLLRKSAEKTSRIFVVSCTRHGPVTLGFAQVTEFPSTAKRSPFLRKVPENSYLGDSGVVGWQQVVALYWSGDGQERGQGELVPLAWCGAALHDLALTRRRCIERGGSRKLYTPHSAP